MIEDVRYAGRQLRKNPGFTAAAVMTLGLGIGAAAAMFGLIQGVLLSPPPYSNPDRLILISPSRLDRQPYTGGVTIGQWLDWRTSSRTLEPPALYRWTFNFLVLPDGSESLGGMIVTSEYFKVLGLTPVLGRDFTSAEAGRPKVPPTGIILGYELWMRRFNGDRRIIGTPIRISRYPAALPVVGVMPAGVRFLPDPGNASEPNYDVNARVDFWLSAAPDETQPNGRGWNAVSRLRAGATVEQARAEIAGLSVRQARTNPNLKELTATAQPLVGELNREARALLLPLFASVGLVFFVACVNVAGLFVARGVQRHREYAMRAALGASRRRLFGQLLTESVVLSLVSAVAGAAVAAGALRLLKTVAGHAIPRADSVMVGWQVFAFGCAAALVAALIAGLLPAARAASGRHFQGLSGGRSTVSRSERRLLGAIATVQIVCTVALLAGAGLLIRTASNLARVRPGYNTENILAVTVTSVTPNSFKEFHTRVLERVSALPGVVRAAFVWGLPLTGNKWPGTMELVGDSVAGTPADQLSGPLRSVTPDYFSLMDIGLVDGRLFLSTDDVNGRPVVIVNQTFAKRYLSGANPLGRQMRFAGDLKRSLEIVGIVSDTRTDSLSGGAEPEVYLPFWQSGAFSKHLVVRAGADPRSLAALVRREVHAVDPTAAVEHVTTMTEIRRESLAPRTFAMRLLIGFSVLATALALVGVYGVLALSVESRLKEIAVRKAIGAQARDIVQLILGDGLRMIAAGVVLGAVAAMVLGRALEGYLFGVRAADPLSLLAAGLAFLVVALGASALPAIRAARADLLLALHQE
jgi:putative ABC transport system permease protein